MLYMTGNTYIDIALFIGILLFSSVFHEVAHAWVAYRCGDDTAYQMGRITLNPFVHICPINTILIPTILYISTGMILGGAKPVPIVPHRLRNPDRDLAISSIAGPMANIVLVIGIVFILFLYKWGFSHMAEQTIPYSVHHFIVLFCLNAIILNLILAFFNMIPIPPLDGSRVLRYLIPGIRDIYDSLDMIGIFLLLILLKIFPEIGVFILNLVNQVIGLIRYIV